MNKVRDSLRDQQHAYTQPDILTDMADKEVQDVRTSVDYMKSNRNCGL